MANMRIEQEAAARVVLVRAVEEILPESIAPETRLDAHIAAGNPAEGSSWIIQRAHYLVDHALAPYGEVLHRLEAPLPTPWLFIGLATVLGLASNYLGPTTKIHVLWNPIVILIAWNVLLYVVLAAGLTLHRHEATTAPPPAVARSRRPRLSKSRYRPRLVDRLVLGPALSWLLGLKSGVEQAQQQAIDIKAVAHRFAKIWWPIARPALGLRLRWTLYLAAIGIAIGAVLGMYVRGLFFAYDVIWQSTFVNDPEVVAVMLRYLLGPAAIALGYPLPAIEDVRQLLTADGDPAARWIHLYAVSAVFFIVIPRSLLTFAVGRRLSRARRRVDVDIHAEYYMDLLQRARAVSPKELEARARNTVREECQQVCTHLTDFVCRVLYDERITRQLWRFREQGGTLRDLEKDLVREYQSFSPELELELVKAEHDLALRLSERVGQLLGEENSTVARPAEGLFGQVSAAPSRSATHVGDRVSGDLATIVASVVSTSVAVVVGTVSGGFGEALGVALLVGVVESGPVGWVIGAVGALVATGAIFALGQEKLREGVKAVHLPPSVLKVALWSGRYERLVAEGRTRCEESVRQALAGPIDRLSSSMGEHLWSRLRVLVGEQLRPRVERQKEPD